MYLSSHNVGNSRNTGSGMDPNAGFAARLLRLTKRSIIWICGVAFAALAAIGTFFFAMAAIIGTFMIAAAIALAFFLFKIFGQKNFTKKSYPANDPDVKSTIILDAKRGPKGWTVNDKRPL